MDKDKSILYRPHIELPKSYYTDGRFDNALDNNNIKQDDTKTQSLIEKIDILKNGLLFVPGAIRPCVESILNLVLFLLVLNKDNNIDDGDEEWEIITPDVPPPIVKNPNTNSGDVNLDEIFKDGHKPKTIMKKTVSDSAKIDRYYSRSTLDISIYYIDSLNDLLSSYNIELMLQPDLEPVLEVIYKAPLLDYHNYVAHNILQTLLKSQEQKINKMRLYQKLYNEKESLTILKSLEYSKLTLLKLTNSEDAPKNPRLYCKHAQIIEGERHKLDKKLFEYYRYLNSSLDALDTILNMHITEAIAKTELNLMNKETDTDANDSTY